MAFPAVTYTFSNGSTADATQVNQNFTDLVNGLSDGTKSLNVAAITAASTVTVNAAITLGQSSTNDLTINASLASTLPVKTNTSFDIGSSNKGLLSVYLGGGGSLTTRILGATLGSSWTLTTPPDAGSANYFMRTDGTGVTGWIDPFEGNAAANLGITASVGSNALTINIVQASGSAPSSTNPVMIKFRSSTAATGTPVLRSLTSTATIVVSSGSTLGTRNGTDGYLYVYAIDNAGTVEAAVSSQLFDEGTRQTTTAEGGGGGATSYNVMYSTTARSNVGVRLVGRLKVNEATAGTWATAPSEISVIGFREKESSWTKFTSVITATGSSPTKGTTSRDDAFWRRVGDSIQLSWQFIMTATGSGGTGTYLFNLPLSLTVDTNKITPIAQGGATPAAYVGSGIFYDGSQILHIDAYMQSSSTIAFFLVNAVQPFIEWGNGVSGFADTSTLQISFRTHPIPISGW